MLDISNILLPFNKLLNVVQIELILAQTGLLDFDDPIGGVSEPVSNIDIVPDISNLPSIFNKTPFNVQTAPPLTKIGSLGSDDSMGGVRESVLMSVRVHVAKLVL